ncbi:MAG: AbrB family transcriptional regulator [Variovorax sp.]|jgi:membrane AbrB-like protein|nr:MAG: AbrB family transcriptional regulator [Variovorax sp.]
MTAALTTDAGAGVPSWRRWLQALWPVAATLALGLAGAALCVYLHTPLPWMIGPLLAVAGLRMAGAPLRLPQPMRNGGQWIIGLALGLNFTPAVTAQLLQYAHWVILSVGVALVVGVLGGRLLQRLSGVDSKTAFFAIAIGGSSEMAIQAERYGGRVDQVAAAHSLRILMVVLIIPGLFRLFGLHGTDLYVPVGATFDPRGFAQLAVLTLAVGWVLNRFRVPNAWIIGPLLVTIALTAGGIQWSTAPRWMVNIGQLLIGCALGIRFNRAFMRTAPRYMASVAAASLLLMGVMAAFGLGLAWVSGIPGPTAVLATAPGGIAEMSLTAKVLQFGVPLVTVFHVSRVLTMVLSIGPLYAWLRPWLERERPVR